VSTEETRQMHARSGRRPAAGGNVIPARQARGSAAHAHARA